MGNTDKIRCPVCGEKFELEPDLEAGDMTSCPGCSADLRIISLNPLKAEAVYDREDDNSDDTDEDEEY